MVVAVMALQGAFAEHERMLQKLGIDTFEVREKSDLRRHKDGLILPGGESTTQLKLLRELGLIEHIRADIVAGLPVLGTCAGLILLSKSVENEPMERISTMNTVVRRNAYGRQLGSFHTVGEVEGVGVDVPMTFIRAPYIKDVGDGVDILARVDGNIVAARQANQLALSFHPELDSDLRIHQYFISMIRETVG